MSNPTCLLIGIHKPIGYSILQKILEEGWSPICLEKEFELLRDIDETERINIRQSDYLDITSLIDILKDVDTVIHAQSIYQSESKSIPRMLRQQQESAACLVNASLISKNVQQFFYISDLLTLHPVPQSDTINEFSRWESAEGQSDYARSRYLAEQEVYRGIAEGLNASVWNLGFPIKNALGEQEKTALSEYSSHNPNHYFHYTVTEDFAVHLINEITSFAQPLPNRKVGCSPPKPLYEIDETLRSGETSKQTWIQKIFGSKPEKPAIELPPPSFFCFPHKCENPTYPAHPTVF